MPDWYEDETTSDEEEFQVKDYEITASPNDFNIKTLFDFITSGVVAIPGFQRNYVWDIKRASKLIESIIIGIPIPQIFLFEEGRNKFQVIDGQQRLMSIYYFMRMRFPRPEKRTELRAVFARENGIPDAVLHDDQYFSSFALRLPENLPDNPNKLNKLNYSTLGDYKTTFDLRTIRNIIVKQNLPADDDSAIYEIFNRLNTGGMNLSPQEIRASLYHSDFYAFLNRSNLDPRWRALIGLPDPDLHMKDVEFLLRGFSLLINGARYRPSMAKFLNNFSKQAKNHTKETNEYLDNLFTSFLVACSELTPRSFFGNTGKFTISIYEAVFAAVCGAAFDKKGLVTAAIAPAQLAALKADPAFIEASQSGTSKSVNVATRLKKARELLAAG